MLLLKHCMQNQLITFLRKRNFSDHQSALTIQGLISISDSPSHSDSLGYDSPMTSLWIIPSIPGRVQVPLSLLTLPWYSQSFLHLSFWHDTDHLTLSLLTLSLLALRFWHETEFLTLELLSWKFWHCVRVIRLSFRHWVFCHWSFDTQSLYTGVTLSFRHNTEFQTLVFSLFWHWDCLPPTVTFMSFFFFHFFF